jgi:hypothetical protein
MCPKRQSFPLLCRLYEWFLILQIGSIFEFFNKNPIFGVVPPDSPFYTPILGFFAITGLPTAGWLFIKAVTAANAVSDSMDKADGF